MSETALPAVGGVLDGKGTARGIVGIVLAGNAAATDAAAQGVFAPTR